MAGKQADIKVGVVTNYDDKGIKQAQTGLAGFKSSIDSAEGAGGKLKAGFNSAKESVIANAGAMGIAAGGALVAFGVKAVGAFTDTAKAALDLGTATGLSTEQASRWIAVGDDFEVSAQALQTGLGKIAKTMDNTKWANYGIATRDAGGNARDTNDILLDSFDVLSKVENETERARIGQELFGKGYQSLTPILGKTRAEYEKMLGTVEDGQVITAEEAEKAEDMRLAQDNLSDALHDVTIQIGAQLAELTPLIEGFAKLVGLYDDIGYLNPLKQAAAAFDGVNAVVETFTHDAEEATLAAEGTAVATAAAAAAAKQHEEATSDETMEIGKNVAALANQGAQVDTTTDLIDDLTRHLDEASAAYDALTGKLDEQDAWQTAQESIFAFNTDTDQTAQDVRDATRALADYTEQMTFIPAEKKTEIFALLNEGDLAKAEALLANLARNRQASIFIQTRGGAGYDTPVNGRSAGGGKAGQGTWEVGEYGKELITAPGANVRNPAETRDIMSRNDGGGATYNIAMPVGTNGDDIIRAIKKWEMRNGPGWRS